MPSVGKKRVIANAQNVPTARPANATLRDSRKTKPAISWRAAPSATRIPISRVRSATEYEVTPKTPTTTNIMSNPPKEAKSVMMGRRRVRDSESYLLRHAAHSPVKLGIQGAKLLAEGCCNV